MISTLQEVRTSAGEGFDVDTAKWTTDVHSKGEHVYI